MSYVPPWLELARQECRMGVKEIPGKEHNFQIVTYGTAVDMVVTTDEIAWCSNFVNWLLLQLDMKRTGSARARSFLQWGVPITNPALGAVVILSRGRGPQPDKHVINAPGHVFLLTDMLEPDTVTGIGGNQRDKVCESTYPLDSVLDMRWPG